MIERTCIANLRALSCPQPAARQREMWGREKPPPALKDVRQIAPQAALICELTIGTRQTQSGLQRVHELPTYSVFMSCSHKMLRRNQLLCQLAAKAKCPSLATIRSSEGKSPALICPLVLASMLHLEGNADNT